MKIIFILLVAALIAPFNAHSQEGACEDAQIYGCGSFFTGPYTIDGSQLEQERITLCGCFDAPDEPVNPAVGIKSCKTECPVSDGVRTHQGCQCLKGPVVIPGLRGPIVDPREQPSVMSPEDITVLYKIKLKDPDLYQIYVDTQLTGNNQQHPMPIEKFIDLTN